MSGAGRGDGFGCDSKHQSRVLANPNAVLLQRRGVLWAQVRRWVSSLRQGGHLARQAACSEAQVNGCAQTRLFQTIRPQSVSFRLHATCFSQS